jgi:hypothetical protein
MVLQLAGHMTQASADKFGVKILADWVDEPTSHFMHSGPLAALNQSVATLSICETSRLGATVRYALATISAIWSQSCGTSSRTPSQPRNPT